VQLAYPINRFRNPRPAENSPRTQAKFYGDCLSFKKNVAWGDDNQKTPWAELYIHLYFLPLNPPIIDIGTHRYMPGKVMYDLGNFNNGEYLAD
jgi:hypothetical protein